MAEEKGLHFDPDFMLESRIRAVQMNSPGANTIPLSMTEAERLLAALRPSAAGGDELAGRLAAQVRRLREEANLDDRASENSTNPDAAPVFAIWATGKRQFADDIEAALRTRPADTAGVGEEHDDEERFLTAYVSRDTRVIGIEHPTEADWHEVRQAHEALRDRLNERLGAQDDCPVKPAMQAPGEGEAVAWRSHDGGPCPVDPESPVEIKIRAGEISTWERAGSVIWEYGTYIHDAGCSMPPSCEVVRYRPLPAPPAALGEQPQ